jgi:uncharacterized SAM-binding protein YcdF (DUF218 family)
MWHPPICGTVPNYHFLQPTFLLSVILGLAIASLWRKRKEPRARLLWVTIPFLLLCLTCMPVTGYLLHGALEWSYPPFDEVPSDTEAIVVLAGNVRAADETRANPELGTDSLYRCVHATRLYRKTKGVPILVSGGPIGDNPDQPSTARVMGDFLRGQGVREGHLIIEGQSENTYENAVESTKLLQARGIRHVVLVTNAEHMLRASGCFRKQGVEVYPSPVQYEATASPSTLHDYLPNPREAGDFELAAREWLAITYYWVRRRI